MLNALRKLKFLIKIVTAYFLYYSGVLFILKNRLNDHFIILTYHRILPESEYRNSFSNNGIIVTPSSFELQLDFLNEHFIVLTMDEFYLQIQDGTKSNKPRCVITFDDGWVDNYLFAYPLLVKKNIPATIFIPVNYIGTDSLFWQERLGRTILSLLAIDNTNATSLLKRLGLEKLSLMKQDIQKEFIISYVKTMKKAPNKEIDLLLEEIEEIVNPNGVASVHIDRYLSWDQIHEMSGNNISFQSHACSHRILTRLTDHEIEQELSESAKIIALASGNTPSYIAYPNGNVNNTVQNLSKACGYKLGFGTKPGHVVKGDDTFDLKRINIHEMKSFNRPLMTMSLLNYY